jgi:hypothetical protein
VSREPSFQGIPPAVVGTAMVGVVARAAGIFESAAAQDYSSVLAGAGALEDEIAAWIAEHIPRGADPATDRWLRERGIR